MTSLTDGSWREAIGGVTTTEFSSFAYRPRHVSPGWPLPRPERLVDCLEDVEKPLRDVVLAWLWSLMRHFTTHYKHTAITPTSSIHIGREAICQSFSQNFVDQCGSSSSASNVMVWRSIVFSARLLSSCSLTRFSLGCHQVEP